MEAVDLGSMFLLGLLGTGHCCGMCGPLVLALPASTGRMAAHLAYHAGRVATYTVVGAIMGGLGQVLLGAAGGGGSQALVRLARIEVGLSLVAAAVLLVLALARLGLLAEPSWISTASPSNVPAFGRLARAASRSRSLPGVLLMGLVMGLLPCGLSFAAFARALGTGDASLAALLVLAFGLGTVPGLLVLGTAASQLARRYRRQSDVLSGLLMVGMAVHLAVESLITFVS